MRAASHDVYNGQAMKAVSLLRQPSQSHYGRSVVAILESRRYAAIFRLSLGVTPFLASGDLTDEGDHLEEPGVSDVDPSV